MTDEQIDAEIAEVRYRMASRGETLNRMDVERNIARRFMELGRAMHDAYTGGRDDSDAIYSTKPA